MSLELWFDGACEPNPGGVATCGWVIELRGETIDEGYRVVSTGSSATNNLAEYSALGLALRSLIASDIVNQERIESLNIYGDSKLVVEQVSGRWQCKQTSTQRLRDRCLELLEKLGIEWQATWIPREENERADALSQRAYVEFTGKPFPRRVKNGAR